MNEIDIQKRVVFDTDQHMPAHAPVRQKNAKMVEFIIAHSGGLITTPASANVFLIIIAGILCVLSFQMVASVGERPLPEDVSTIEGLAPGGF